MVFEPPTQARVDEIELKFRTVEQQGQHPMPMRVVASSKTGQWLKIDSYKEFPEPITGMAMYFCSLDNADRCYLEPYTISSDVEIKRATARRIGTTYVYDFLGLTEKSLIQRWDAYVSERPELKRPDMLFEASELGLDEDGKRARVSKATGTVIPKPPWEVPCPIAPRHHTCSPTGPAACPLLPRVQEGAWGEKRRLARPVLCRAAAPPVCGMPRTVFAAPSVVAVPPSRCSAPTYRVPLPPTNTLRGCPCQPSEREHAGARRVRGDAVGHRGGNPGGGDVRTFRAQFRRGGHPSVCCSQADVARRAHPDAPEGARVGA